MGTLNVGEWVEGGETVTYDPGLSTLRVPRRASHHLPVLRGRVGSFSCGLPCVRCPCGRG